jgi:hypothetical protein
MEISIKPNPACASQEARNQILAAPGFGKFFTDHMVSATWSQGRGWHDAQVMPYGPIAMDPASAVLHYAQEIFEGLKAYRHADGSVWSFRPQANAQRFNRSAARLAMPEVPEALFLDSIRELVKIDAAWVPGGGEEQHVPAPLHVRLRGVPGRASGQRIQVHGDCIAGRRVFLRRGQARQDLAVVELCTGGVRRHWRRQMRRQLRRGSAGADGGDRSAAANRCASSTPPSTNGSKSWVA